MAAAAQAGLQAPAVDRALDLLELLSTAPGGLTLSELSARLDLPKNAVFRIAGALRARGYLARDAETLRFSLTDRFVRLFAPRTADRSLIEIATDVLRALRNLTRETVQIGCRVGREGVILEVVEGLEPLRISVDPGLRFPLYNNAPGKLLLAWMPERERAAMIASLDLAPCTARTITDRRELARECGRIRALGYSVDHAEADEGIHCVASAVRGHDGEALAAIWVSAPSRRLPKSAFPEVGRRVRDAAEEIRRRFAQP